MSNSHTLSGFAGFPGQVFSTSSVSGNWQPYASSPSYTCSCGNLATNICENKLLCSGCFFQYSVAKAAGRLEEFWAAVEKKVEEKARKFQEEYSKQMQVAAVLKQKYYAHQQQAQQNYGQGLQNSLVQQQGQKQQGFSGGVTETDETEHKQAKWKALYDKMKTILDREK